MSTKQKIGVFALMFFKKEIFLVKKNYGNRKWFLPGGSPLPGESLVDALKREIKEETGQTVATGRLKYSCSFYMRQARSVAFLFTCRLNKKAEIKFNRHELQDVGLFLPSDAKEKVSSATNMKIRFGTAHTRNNIYHPIEY